MPSAARAPVPRLLLLAALVAVALVLAALAAAATAAAAAPELKLKRCYALWTPGGVGDRKPALRSECGRLAVPLDRSGAVRGRVRLHVQVATPRRGPVRETLVLLAGGPGQAAPALETFAKTLGPLLGTRRLVTFDQRGTGRSDALSCPSLGRDRVGVDRAVAACAKRLGPARTAYTTAASVADIEALRRALRAPRLTLLGTSYGTKVALDYAARHPRRVTRLVLDSVVPPAGADPFARSTMAATPRVLQALCSFDRCPFSPDPASDVAALVQRMRADGPLRGRWHDRRGQARPVELRPRTVLQLLVESDLDPFLGIALPAALHSARAGDPAALARLAAPRQFAADDADISDALYLATHCSDGGVPWPAGTPIAQRRAATVAALAAIPPAALAPFDAATLREDPALGLCRSWPESPVAQRTRPLPDVPTLMLAGELDLRTPREDALAVAARLLRARVLDVPLTGHSVLGMFDDESCAARAVRRFLTGAAVRDCPPPRAMVMPEISPAPASFDALAPLAGLPERHGRTAAAVAATFADVEYEGLRAVIDFMDSDWDIDDTDQPKIGWGGLRGGRATRDLDTKLEDYEVVPGVTVSGTGVSTEDGDVSSLAVYRLRVGGSAAVHGRLRVDGHWISGRLAGQRIRVRNPAPPLFPDGAVADAAAAAARR